jgi:hypothetical protein
VSEPLHRGAGAVPAPGPSPEGRLVTIDGETFQELRHAEGMRPFLVALVSDSDHWLFASSHGGLTAGRRNPGRALFPYVTEDKLQDAAGVTGPATAILVTRDATHARSPFDRLRTSGSQGVRSLWHPLRDSDRLVWRIERRLAKSILGDRLVFEETNLDLAVRFRAEWRTSDRFGFVRGCALENLGGPAEVELVDGLLNLLPADVEETLQASMSCLVDAYKQAERVAGTSLALYTLAAQVVDRPEPRESLHATTVWSHGLPGARVHLLADALERFDLGLALATQDEMRGRRGAYLLHGEAMLPPGGAVRWRLVADVARPQRAVAALCARLADPGALVREVDADLAAGAERLRGLVAAADGVQCTGDANATAHHAANVVFNVARGGVFAAGHDVPGPDFAAFVARMNRPVAARHAALLAALPARLPRAALLERLAATGDPDLERLGFEYLPLTFSRRHGDPSRPWNRFDIRVRDDAGCAVLAWQGNWRDIFQNWEALALSHPDFVEHLVAKFVNASTPDGHNPYRLSSDGIDWEVPDPEHPWSAIGYWGDHQLVYLHRLLALSARLHPERLAALLERPRFSYADVPYRIAPFEVLVANPRATIAFDAVAHRRALARVAELGGDGRLVPDAGGGAHHATLVEKLLVPALAKLANLVPGGGVWMNTGRPEWNDANNALAGFGLSVVTAAHLERYLAFLPALLAPLRGRSTPLAAEVATWAERTLAALRAHHGLLKESVPPELVEGRQESVRPEPVEGRTDAIGDAARGAFLREVGEAASRYRAEVYARGFSGGVRAFPVEALVELAELGAAHARRTLALARRSDGLFHSYNLLLLPVEGLGVNGVGVAHLPEMLEGQVAVLSSGLLDDAAACDLLDALRKSALWREDQRSYLLYPDRRLPGFLEKNVVPEAALESCPPLARLLAGGGAGIVARDAEGRVRFDERFVSAAPLRAALETLLRPDDQGSSLSRAESDRSPEPSAARERVGVRAIDAADLDAILAVYESVFHHHAFTGRSGSMFAYEGLGSIYWHMVAKLLVAVQERLFAAADADAPRAVLDRLVAHYRELRAGLGGLEKTPAEYGAFPLDPYSHTPAGSGARQPGMTGQVKEEVITRLGELGVRLDAGRVRFAPLLLRVRELLPAPAVLETCGADGAPLRLALEAGTLGFTFCGVPVVYHLADARRVVVARADGTEERVEGDGLDARASADVLARNGRVRRLDVFGRVVAG